MEDEDTLRREVRSSQDTCNNGRYSPNHLQAASWQDHDTTCPNTYQLHWKEAIRRQRATKSVSLLCSMYQCDGLPGLEIKGKKG